METEFLWVSQMVAQIMVLLYANTRRDSEPVLMGLHWGKQVAEIMIIIDTISALRPIHYNRELWEI